MTEPAHPTTWFGWTLVGLGGVAIIGSALPWITLSGPQADAITLFIEAKGGGLGGLDHGGAVTVVLGIAAVVLGVGRILGRLRHAAAVGAVVGLLMAAVAAVAAADHDLADQFHGQVDRLAQGAGLGVWVTLAAAVAIIGASLVALARREGTTVEGGATPPQASASSTSSSSISSTDSMIPVTASTSDGNEAIDS